MIGQDQKENREIYLELGSGIAIDFFVLGSRFEVLDVMCCFSKSVFGGPDDGMAKRVIPDLVRCS